MVSKKCMMSVEHSRGFVLRLVWIEPHTSSSRIENRLSRKMFVSTCRWLVKRRWREKSMMLCAGVQPMAVRPSRLSTSSKERLSRERGVR